MQDMDRLRADIDLVAFKAKAGRSYLALCLGSAAMCIVFAALDGFDSLRDPKIWPFVALLGIATVMSFGLWLGMRLRQLTLLTRFYEASTR